MIREIKPRKSNKTLSQLFKKIIKNYRMKKLTICLMTIFMSLAFVPSPTMAKTTVEANSTTTRTAEESARANSLLLRLKEIESIDKSKLTSPEKSALRKEVRSTKKELKELGGGIYLSAGAVILIIILIIIL